MGNTYSDDVIDEGAAPYPLPKVDLNLLPDVDNSKLPQSPLPKRSKGL